MKEDTSHEDILQAFVRRSDLVGNFQTKFFLQSALQKMSANRKRETISKYNICKGNWPLGVNTEGNSES
jgi:hypothetical protein